MSSFYNPGRTYRFDPNSPKPFPISRSKLDLFLNCPRCFYLDRRLGIGQPPGFPFTLNNAVDQLLKKEFDSYRAERRAHPLMTEAGIDAIPFNHERLEQWRDARKAGIRFVHIPSDLELHGGIDDVWVTPNNELILVDYKATAKNGAVNLDAAWQIAYKRQIEVYQWLFRQNGFQVSKTGVFVYCNADISMSGFYSKLEFRISLLTYEGATDWIEPALAAAKECLLGSKMPRMGADCDYCRYRKAIKDLLPSLARIST